MDPKGEKKFQARVKIPIAGFRRSLPVNRFVCSDAGHALLLHFGFVNSQGFLLDAYSCVIDKHDIGEARDRHVKYLEKLGGALESKEFTWMPPVEPRPIDLARFIFMCHTGGSAEISLSGFSVGGVINASKGTQAVEIDPDPLVVMSCTVEMQRYVITQIFLEKHA